MLYVVLSSHPSTSMDPLHSSSHISHIHFLQLWTPFLLEQGKVHVAVGFVDFALLLQAQLSTEEQITQPAHFIGYLSPISLTIPKFLPFFTIHLNYSAYNSQVIYVLFLFPSY
jgi:hypothetical protein